MARYSKTLTPAAEAAFLAALRGGALVVAAAATASVAVSTLYCRRRRDAAFDRAWSSAAEASFGFAWRRTKKRRGRKARPVRVATKRRVRFAATRRGLFLAALERSCDTKNSARWAGVWPSTVYRNLKRDPGFAKANEAALERGYGRLERQSDWARTRGAERMIGIVERIAAAMAAPASAFDRHMGRLKRRWRPDGPRVWRGPGFARAPAEAMAELTRKIRRIQTGLWQRSLGPGPPPGAEGGLRA